MLDNNSFDVIIVGGSYAGLSAGMALGRALKKVLIIDDGKPCNRQTPYSHNFLTNDGRTPGEISVAAKWQISRYDTVTFFTGTATGANQTAKGFDIEVAAGEIFTAKKLIFATGINDLLPAIDGISDCWGISVIHCPYCHGYEVKNKKTDILGNGEPAFDFIKLISNWTKDLTLLTNGDSTLHPLQKCKLEQQSITIDEREIERLLHINGCIDQIIFKDGSQSSIEVLYAPSPFEQHCKIPESLGCELTAEGYLKTDGTHETSVRGIYAIGDNAAKMRTVANAVAMGTSAGLIVSKKMILEEF